MDKTFTTLDRYYQLGRMHHCGAFRVLVHYTCTTLRPALGEFTELCIRHLSVNYAAGAIIKRCNWISMVLCAILRYCQTTRSSDDVHRPASARCDPHREVHRLTLCTWYVQHNQEFHTHVEYMCNQKDCFPKSWLHWLTSLYLPLSFFLSFFLKTQLNHWINQMVNTWLTT